MSDILKIENLSVSFRSEEGEAEVVRGVSFSLKKGETLAIVGESGSGKSVLCKSIMKLLPHNAYIKSGKIFLNDVDITSYIERDMQRLRGSVFSMIFQDPMSSLNPTVSIGRQIAEAVRLHSPKMKRADVKSRAIELMELVGIEDAKERYNLYPHDFSGGMRQRSVIAVAIAQNPAILFADEPTTSLDVTIQTQILDLLRDIQKKPGMAMVFVTHDLGVVARIADRVAVMYAGKIVEIGTAEEIFYDPKHPYTCGLMKSLPCFAEKGKELYTISGFPPSPGAIPKGDAFAPRNEYALQIDYEEEPPFFKVSDTHYAATWLLDKRAPKVLPPVRRDSDV